MKTQHKSRRGSDEWEADRHPHFVYGVLAEATGQIRSAFAHYRLEIRATGYFKAYHCLGTLLLHRGRLTEARDAFRAAIRRGRGAGQPELTAGSLNSLGLVYDRLGLPAKAVAAWHRSARLDPKSSIPLVNLSLRHLLDGDRARGVSRLLEALRRCPRDLKTRRWVGYALVKYDLDVRRGLRYLEAAERVQAYDARLLADLSSAYQKLGMTREARSARQRAKRFEARTTGSGGQTELLPEASGSRRA